MWRPHGDCTLFRHDFGKQPLAETNHFSLPWDDIRIILHESSFETVAVVLLWQCVAIKDARQPTHTREINKWVAPSTSQGIQTWLIVDNGTRYYKI